MHARTTMRGARCRAGAWYRERAALTFFFPSSPPILAIAVPSLPLHLLPCLHRAQPVTAPPLPFPLRRREPDDRRPIPLPFPIPPSGHQDRAPPSLFSSSSPIRPREFNTTKTSPSLPFSPSPLCSLSVTAADRRRHHSQCPPFPPSLILPSTARLFLFIFSFVSIEHCRRPPLRRSHYPRLHRIDVPSLLSLLFFPPRRLRRRPPIIAPPLPISLSIVMTADNHCPPPPAFSLLSSPTTAPDVDLPLRRFPCSLRLLHHLQTATTFLHPLRPPSCATAVTNLPAGHSNFSPRSLLSRWVGDGFGKRRRVGCGLSHNGLDWVRWAL